MKEDPDIMLPKKFYTVFHSLIMDGIIHPPILNAGTLRSRRGACDQPPALLYFNSN